MSDISDHRSDNTLLMYDLAHDSDLLVSDAELDKALRTDEIKSLLANADPPPDQRDLMHELRRRRREIKLDIGRAQEAFHQARLRSRRLEADIDARARSGRHRTLLTLSALYLGFLAVAMLGTFVWSWAWAEAVMAFWEAPRAAGRLPTAAWIGGAVALALVIFEAAYLRWRVPKRKIRLADELGLAATKAEVERARTARDQLLVDLVRSHVIDVLNRTSSPAFAPIIYAELPDEDGAGNRHATIGAGLSETMSRENEIPTDARQRILDMIERLPGGSIGISGPRGVGKSTLLASVCAAKQSTGPSSAITVNTAAPVEYEARDFLLHLFSALCRSVLRAEGLNPDEVERTHAGDETRRWQQMIIDGQTRLIARFLGAVGIMMLAVGVLISAYNDDIQRQAEDMRRVVAAAQMTQKTTTTGEPSAAPLTNPPAAAGSTPSAAAPTSTPNPLGLYPGPFTMLGLAALVVAFALATRDPARRMLAAFAALLPFGRRRAVGRLASVYLPLPGMHRDLVERCATELRNVRFQRSYTSGWSGMLKVPAGLELGTTAGLTLQQQAESLPELVERFRNFVGRVAGTYGSVVFGIDELDKLKSRSEAESFLNGIKSVFGIDRCFYLISVSEDALSAFDRRGIGIRDAFDSALDEVLHVGFLNLAQSRALLNRRILRLPDPFLQLCHMMSGGLPRDLIRHARQLLDVVAGAPGREMSVAQAVDALVREDVRAKVRASQVAIRALPELPETSGLLAEIAKLSIDMPLEQIETQVGAYQAYRRGLGNLQSSDDGRRLARFAHELATYVDMMMLLRRVGHMLSTQPGWRRASKLRLAERIAEIRQALEIGVSIAEVRIAALRPEVDGAAKAKGAAGARTPKKAPANDTSTLAPSPASAVPTTRRRRSRAAEA